MKKILLTVVLLSALTAAQAHTRHTRHTARAHSHAASAASDDTVIYLGTNEFYIALEREGVYRG